MQGVGGACVAKAELQCFRGAGFPARRRGTGRAGVAVPGRERSLAVLGGRSVLQREVTCSYKEQEAGILKEMAVFEVCPGNVGRENKLEERRHPLRLGGGSHVGSWLQSRPGCGEGRTDPHNTSSTRTACIRALALEWPMCSAGGARWLSITLAMNQQP